MLLVQLLLSKTRKSDDICYRIQSLLKCLKRLRGWCKRLEGWFGTWEIWFEDFEIENHDSEICWTQDLLVAFMINSHLFTLWDNNKKLTEQEQTPDTIDNNIDIQWSYISCTSLCKQARPQLQQLTSSKMIGCGVRHQPCLCVSAPQPVNLFVWGKWYQYSRELIQ